MAILKNTNDLLAQNANTLPDNTTQEISPQDVREAIDNTAFSSYNKITDAPLVGLKVYNTGVVYETGQGCTFGGVVQVANKQTTPGPFNPADWDATVSVIPDPQVVSVTSTSEASINVDTTDVYEITAQAETLLFGSLSGTPIDGKRLIVRITDDGTARSIIYNGSNFRSALTLPAQTVTGETIYFHCVYNAGASIFDIYNVSIEPSKENPDYLNTGLGTGVLTGGTLTPGTPNTTFSISAGEGYIVDTQSNPGTPMLTKLTWSAKNNLAVTNLATQLATFVSIDSAGVVIQRATNPTPEQRRQEIFLGAVIHYQGTQVEGATNRQQPSANTNAQLADLFDGLGVMNYSGNALINNGQNLKLDKTAGVLMGNGLNFGNDENNPHFLSVGSLTQATFEQRFQDGTVGTIGTDIDPNTFDNIGNPTAVPAGNFTAQRIFLTPDNTLVVQPGQNLYQSLSSAKGAISKEIFNVDPSLKNNAVLLAVLVVQEGATDLTSPATSEILTAGRFGELQGIGGTSVSTLQDAYNNGFSPLIVTSSALGAVNVRQGSGSDLDNIYQGQNGAGATTFAVNGNGDVSGTTFDGRDVSVDGSKLDGIEPLADVTDSANVASAGATMNTDTDLTGNGYFKNDGTFASPDPTKVPSEQAVKTYVDNNVSGAKSYQGEYNANTNTPDLESGTGVLKGQQWDVTTAGQFFTEDVEVGDVVTAKVDAPTVLGDWVIGQTNLTPASIKTQYESNADTNAFTDAEKSKLSGIEANATADQSDTEIETAYNNQVSVVSQAEAEAGTSTTVRRWTAERVKQAIEALGVADDSITNAKLANMNANTFKGRTSGSGDPQDIGSGSLSTVALDAVDHVVGFESTGELKKFSADRILGRALQSQASSASITADCSLYDQIYRVNQAEALTINNPINRTSGAKLLLAIKDDGTSRALTFGSEWRAMGVTLPTATTAEKWLYIGAIFNGAQNRWDVLMVNEQA